MAARGPQNGQRGLERDLPLGRETHFKTLLAILGPHSDHFEFEGSTEVSRVSYVLQVVRRYRQ